MNAQRTGIRLLATLVASALLAACAAGPVKPLPQSAVVMAHPEPAPTTLTPLAPAIASGEPWASLSTRFVLHDCADSPLIRVNAAMYTRSPAHFEQRLAQSMPLMIYVQKQLHDAGIPGEFTMLPMLESSYRPAEPSRAGDASGMWQMMPGTARLHGLVVNRDYDGRLDPVASTKAAIHMLKQLQQQFGDWRLVDMAYNAGPYAVLGALRGHPELGDAIPDIAVSRHTRTHLARLMALSCIIRQPERFHVSLPKASPADALQAVQVPAGTSLRAIATMAQTPESQLRALNPGYRGAKVPADSPRMLLLPDVAAQALVAALTIGTSETVAQVTTRVPDDGATGAIPLPTEPTPPAVVANPSGATAHHRVRAGETLWSIAHRYHVSVGDLQRWNHLNDDGLRTGEELRIQG